MLSTFDPASPTAEDTAFGAMQTLNSGAPDLDQPLPDRPDTTRRAFLQETLRTYAEDRRVRGLPVFPRKTAEANRSRDTYLRDIFTKPLDKVLTPEQYAPLKQRLDVHHDPETYTAREVTRTFLSAVTGKPLTGAQYDLIRDQYARQNLGLKEDTSDKAVFSAIRTRYQEDSSTAEATSAKITEILTRQLSTIGKLGESAQNTATTSARDGRRRLYEPPTTAEREEFLKTLPERHRDSVREQWNTATRELSRLFTKHTPLVEQIVKAVEQSKDLPFSERAVVLQLDEWTKSLPDNPKERAVVMAMLSNVLANNPTVNKDALARFTNAINRGIRSASAGIVQATQAQARQGLKGIGVDPNAFEFTSDAETENIQRRRELYSAITGSAMELRTAADGFLASSAIAAAPSAWMIPAAFTPIGQAAMVQTFTGDSIQRAATDFPEVNEGLRTNMATASGMAQATIETLSNVAGVRIMLGKLPTFSALLNRANVTTPAARAALGFAAGAGATGAMEYTEEAAQGAVDTYLQALAADLSSLKPNIDWKKYFADWATAAGPEQQETLLAVAGFAMIAGAGASFNHFKYGAALARNRTFLRAHGLTEAEVRDVILTAEKDPDAAAQKAAAFVDLAAARPKTAEEEAALAEERKAAIELLRARNTALQEAGLPVISRETNTFTEETEFIFTDPVTGQTSRHATEDDALIAWRDWSRQQTDDHLDTIREAATTDFLDFQTSEGQAGENVEVIDSRAREVSLESVQQEALAKQKAAEADVRKARTPADERSAQERVTNAKQRLDWLKARLDVLIFDEGLSPAAAAGVFRNTIVRARTFSRKVMDRVVGYTVELFRGANLQDITEEFAEANVRSAMDEGLIDPEVLLENIRDYERASGARLIAPEYEYDSANPIPLIEGFSKLARGVLLAEVNSSVLPETVSRWIRIQAALEAASIDLANDLRTAADFRAALDAGYVPDRLRRFVTDYIGLDPAERDRRLRQRYEEQLAAEAMGGFPEIRETLRGKLPHPETLRANSHPLYGEVRRIWESLKRPTKRRTKEGRTIDRTNEANAYFLPEGIMEDLDLVRRSIAEDGFDFDTPADMLDALDASISYNKPFYGTTSTGLDSGPDSFSLSRIDPNQPGGANIGDAALPDFPRDAMGGISPMASIQTSGFDFLSGKVKEGAYLILSAANDFDGKIKIHVVGGDIEAAKQEFLRKASKIGYEPTGKIVGRSNNPIDGIQLVHVKAQTEFDKLLAASEKKWSNAKQVFLRYGPPPESGFSKDHSNGISEKGVSVYRGLLLPSGETKPIFETNQNIGSMLLGNLTSRRLFVVEGEEVGYGADGEPVLKLSKVMTAKQAAKRYFNQSAPADPGATQSPDTFALAGPKAKGFSAAKSEGRVFKGHDGKERFELDTSKAKPIEATVPNYGWGTFTDLMAGNTAGITLEKLIDFPELFYNYPQAKDLWVRLVPGKSGGNYNLGTNAITIGFDREKREISDRQFSVLLHEIQHWIQTKEGFQNGGSPDQFAEERIKLRARLNGIETSEEYQTALKTVDRMWEQFWEKDNPTEEEAARLQSDIHREFPVMKEANRLMDEMNSLDPIRASDLDRYRMIPGEREARGVQARASMTAEERAAKPFMTGWDTYALSTKSVLRLEEAIARRMTQGPDERVAFYNRLRDRLAGTVLQLREAKRNLATDPTEAERERNRIQDALAEARTVIDALPAEARGRVSFNPAEVMDATTERGQVNAILRLIDRADEALETVLSKEYDEAFETLLDLAKPDLRQNKSIRGRLNPETQRMVGQVIDAVLLDPAAHAAALTAQNTKLEDLRNATPTTPEEIKAAQQALAAAEIEYTILETFGNYSRMTASEKAHAYEQLLSIYTRGRTIRRTLDEARREEIQAQVREVLSSLPRVDQAKHRDRTADKGFFDQAGAWMLGFSSFHQVMERLFPKSTTARDFQERVRAADRAFTRARIAARERFDAFTFGVWNLTGPSRTRARNQILADLSKVRDWNITLQEGVTFETVKLTEEQAAAILAGEMKTGWESDPIARTSLAQALADFRMQRLKAQNEDRAFRSKVIQFQRLVSRGEPGAYRASDLEALYFLQLHAQEQYRPALDRYGFTSEVIEAIARQINPKALDVADFLREEYDDEYHRLNPVYQRLYGLDLPRIRNYAPGIFEHQDAKSGDGPGSTLDTYGSPAAVNAMSAGFTKARTHHLARPTNTNALAAYWSHIEATEYFIHWAELTRDLRAVFRSPQVRRALEGNFGTDAARIFSQWLDALEVDGNFRATELATMARMVNKSLAATSAIGLAYNLGVLLKQIPAAFGFILDMPTGAAVRGIAAALRRPSTLRAVWSSEAIQQRILAGISPEDRKLLDASYASPSLIMELLELGRLPIAYADAAFTTLSASVAYAHHLEAARTAGLSPADAEKSALAAASRVIERTAQPATTQDKSLAENTARMVTKVLFMFRSDPRQKLAIVANAIADVRAGKTGSKSAAARKILFGWILYGLSNELLSDVWQSITRDEDDPERWAWEDYAVAALVGPSSSIPFIGQAYELTLRSTLGTRAFGSSENPADQTLRAVSSATKLITQITEEDAQDWTANEWLTASQQFAAAIAAVAGMFDPRAAGAPALLRLARDAQGAADNLITTEDEEARAIIAQVKADTKPEREARSKNLAATTARLAAMDTEARARALAELPDADRATVARRLKLRAMTLTEQELAKLPKNQRAIAIDRITATMPESDAAAYRERLRSLKLLDE